MTTQKENGIGITKVMVNVLIIVSVIISLTSGFRLVDFL
jgi:hypothetical protein